MPRSEEEILKFIEESQERAIAFLKSGKEQTKRKISQILREERTGEIGSKCPTCYRIITIAHPPSRKSYDPIDSSLTIEHLFPLRLGGDNKSHEYMVAMCHYCNSTRNSVMQKFLSFLYPKTPRQISQEQTEKVNRFVMWSIASVCLPERTPDDEIQAIWLSLQSPSQVRERPDEVSQLHHKISILERRLEELENTPWKRFTRFIRRPFRRKTKTTPKKTIEEPKTKSSKRKTRRSKPINSVEKFDLDTWIDENWQGEQSYIQLRDAILAHEEGNNGKRLLKDILKEDFDIPKSWTIARKSLHWGESKHPSVENSQEGQQSTSSQYPLIPKFNQAATGLRLPREPEQLSEVIALNEITDNDMDPKERNQKIAEVVSIGQARVMRTIWHIGKLSDTPNPLRGGRKVLKALEELVSEGRQWGEWDESEREQITQYFSRAQDHMAAQHPLTSDDNNKDDSKEGITDIRLEGISEFKHIIKEILALEDDSIVTVSAMGQRFSKEIQSIGYYNKKDFFRQNGIDHNLTIQQAIIEFLDEEEVSIEITRGVKCVVLNRRD